MHGCHREKATSSRAAIRSVLGAARPFVRLRLRCMPYCASNRAGVSTRTPFWSFQHDTICGDAYNSGERAMLPGHETSSNAVLAAGAGQSQISGSRVSGNLLFQNHGASVLALRAARAVKPGDHRRTETFVARDALFAPRLPGMNDRG